MANKQPGKFGLLEVMIILAIIGIIVVIVLPNLLQLK